LLFDFDREVNPEKQQVLDYNEEPNKSVFRKKKSYSFKDLIDFYEKTRFTLPFMVYRAMKYWTLFDYIALYGHVISNFMIVYAAINFSNSFFNCFNILCVSLFYLVSAQIVHNKAHLNYDASGL